jgi:hypothetical protein
MNYQVYQVGHNKIYIRRINAYLGIGREYSINNEIIYEGYYKYHGSNGWKQVSL